MYYNKKCKTANLILVDLKYKLLTWAMSALAAKPVEISLAMSIGEVINFLPSFTEPLGNVIL